MAYRFYYLVDNQLIIDDRHFKDNIIDNITLIKNCTVLTKEVEYVTDKVSLKCYSK